MANTIKGSELIKALEEGELKEGQQVRFTSTITSETKIAIVITSPSGLYLQDTDTENVINTGWLTNSKIEILEEQQDIDIQKLDENIQYCNIIEHSENEKVLFNMIQDTANRINKLVQAVKQLDKNIKDKER